jgi:CO/xanthine dehydrogenase Mo-binding subunit
VVANAASVSGVPYHLPSWSVEAVGVYTNLPPGGSCAGFGLNQSAWACETHMDMIAERLSLDPLELRLCNLDSSDGAPAGGVGRLLRSAAEGVGWSEGASARHSARMSRAKGFACVAERDVLPTTSTATVRLNDDGSVNVLIGAVESGQRLRAELATLSSERLGIDTARVHVSRVDTALTSYDHHETVGRGAVGSRIAVSRALDDVVVQLAVHGAPLLGCALADVRIEDGTVVGPDGAPLAFADLVRRAAVGNVIGHGRFQSPGADGRGEDGRRSAAAAAAEVEVDLDTGSVQVLRYHSASFGDRVEIASALSQALFEEIVFEEGRPRAGNLDGYMIASFSDLPRSLVLESVDDPEELTVAETALGAVAPAIGNAVARAIGGRVTTLPITPERVLRALRDPEWVAR